jgi:hypothetical protein
MTGSCFFFLTVIKTGQATSGYLTTAPHLIQHWLLCAPLHFIQGLLKRLFVQNWNEEPSNSKNDNIKTY